MTVYECPNCGQEYTEDEVKNGEVAYTDGRSDPYTGLSYTDYFCVSCVDEYKEETSVLRRVFTGKSDKLDFKLRTK